MLESCDHIHVLSHVISCLSHMTKHVESHVYGKYIADLYTSFLGGGLAERGNAREGGD